MKQLIFFFLFFAAVYSFGQTDSAAVARFDVSRIKATPGIVLSGLKDSLVDRKNIDSLLELGAQNTAIRLLTEELIVNPGNVYAIQKIGYLYNSSGSPEKAVPYFLKAIEMVPNEPTFHYNLGLAYKRLNLNQQAVDAYSEAIRIDPKDKLSYYNRALAYEALRKFGAAITDYDTELTINGEQARVYNNRGRCWMILENYDQALADFNRALEIDPARILAYRNRATLYLRMDKKEKACADLRKAVELGDTDTRLLNEVCK